MPNLGKTRLGLPIDRICIDYHRTSKSYPKTQEERDAWQYFFWDYSEHLTIDRLSGTITLVQSVDADCTVTHTYRMKQTVTSLLDHFSATNLFFSCRTAACSNAESMDDEQDLIQDPNNRTFYHLTVQYEKGPDLLLSGRYDKSGLPKDFSELMSDVFSLIQHYGAGEMIFPSTYQRSPRRKSDLIYCSVAFDDSFITYYYRTEDGSIAKGDRVLVPVGQENRPTLAKVVEVEYFAPDEVPFPIEKTKYILRRCTEKDPEQDQ